MAATRIELVIHKEDGTSVPVTADQRDIAAFERQEKIGVTRALEDCPTVFWRSIAWNASRRLGLTKPAERQADWENEVIDVELADEEPVGPTSAEMSATT